MLNRRIPLLKVNTLQFMHVSFYCASFLSIYLGLKVSRIALYGGVAGCGVMLLATFTAIFCCWKWQKFKLLHRG